MFSILKKNKNKLLAIYDLEKINCSHDFLVFFQNVILFKKKKGIKNIYLILLPGSLNGFKPQQFKREKKNKLYYAQSRLNNIVLPSVNMFRKYYDNFIHLKNRAEFLNFSKSYDFFFPENYNLNINKHKYTSQCIWINLEKNYKNVSLTKLNLPKLFVNNLKKKIKSKKRIVTITLREGSYTVERNSSKKDWLKFVNYLNKENYNVIIIRDFENINKKDMFEEYELFPNASYDIVTRTALYSISDVNFFVDGGPQTICWINGYKSISWKVWGDGKQRGLYEDNLGLERDELSKVLNPYKNILLSANDNFKNLIKFKNYFKKKAF